MVSEVLRVDDFVAALRAGDWDSLGPLMDASHASLRDDYEVSCEELDVAVETAQQSGALGARMTGGGFGGSAIALVPVERVDAVQAAVATAFVARGWGVPTSSSPSPVPAPGCGSRPHHRGPQVASTPMSPLRKASTNSAWSRRTVAA